MCLSIARTWPPSLDLIVFVIAAVELDDNLTGAVVVDLLELANVACDNATVNDQ